MLNQHRSTSLHGSETMPEAVPLEPKATAASGA